MANGLVKLQRCCVALLLTLLGAFGTARAGETIVLASTTSTEQSGLFGFILPKFTAKTGIEVKVVALGTGQALELGRRGDADVLLVHDRPAEERFVVEGHGAYRKDVMYNDFVIVGPASDPAGVKGEQDAVKGFALLGKGAAPFVSRADTSGTHAAERRLWKEAGVAPVGQPWYKESGSGMGPTLNMAASLDGYTLSDRGTWASFRNRLNLAILLQGDPRLYNPYGVILVNPDKHPHVNKAAAERFIDWITSSEGRAAIADYKPGGEQLFFPALAAGR